MEETERAESRKEIGRRIGETEGEMKERRE